MINLLLPIGVGLLAGTAWFFAKKPQKGEMTPERQVVLDTALSSTKEPDKLRALAKVFRDEGLALQADLLEQRAKLRELPADVKEGRREAFRAGMSSQNAGAVRALADEFEKEGATGAAAALRTYAFSLDHPTAGSGLPGTGTIDGHGTGLIPELMPTGTPFIPTADPIAAATQLIQQGQAPANANTSIAQIAAAAEQAKLDSLRALGQHEDHPEADALASGLAGLPVFSPNAQ
jgi:hypothetical protein